jgi:hypothetical protein
LGLVDGHDADRAIDPLAHEGRRFFDDSCGFVEIAALSGFVGAIDAAACHAEFPVFEHRARIDKKTLVVEFAVRIGDQTLVA